MLLAAAASSSSTTSVPTWLAVFAIVAPVLTGWVGALLAWMAATRTAERNAALTRQDEQRRWNRERRDRAYVTLLNRRNHMVELKNGWVATDDHESAEFDAWESLKEALAEVELAGTPTAVELARRWVHLLCGPGPTVEQDGTVLDNPLQEEEVEFRDPFVALIRKELGVDD